MSRLLPRPHVDPQRRRGRALDPQLADAAVDTHRDGARGGREPQRAIGDTTGDVQRVQAEAGEVRAHPPGAAVDRDRPRG